MRCVTEELRSHYFFTEGRIAVGLRARGVNFEEILDNFLNSKTDSEKIKNSINFVEKICRANDIGDLVPLYAQVAMHEYDGLLAYKKQRDHTSHTVSLFLLGGYLIDNNILFYDQLMKKIDHEISRKSINTLILEWVIASLFHDVGYLFADQTTDALLCNIKLVQKMFQKENIKRELERDYEIEDLSILDNEIESFLEKQNYNQLCKSISYNQEGCYQTINQIINAFLTLLNEKKSSSNVEYGKIITEFTEQLELFHKTKYSEELNDIIPHDFIGGLLVFSYTLMWYELKNNDVIKAFKLKEDRKFTYNKKSLEFVKEGCLAIALHDVATKLEFSTNPLLYISILCDEIQIWDRFQSGIDGKKLIFKEVIDMIEMNMDYFECIKNDPYSSNNIFLSNRYDDNGKCKIKLEMPCSDSGKIKESLKKKLVGWEEYLELK